MSTNTPTELELQTTKVTTNPLQVEVGSDLAVKSTTNVSVDTVQQESIIEGYKKEYSIVGDGLYASVSMDQAPQWLLGLIGGVIDSQLQSGLFDLHQANQSIRDALDGIDIAKNQYAELINIDATIEGIIASRLTTLNATVDANSANIITLDTVTTMFDQAIAISADRVTAELNNGRIKAQLDRIDTSVATTNGSLVATTEIMEASFEGVSDAVSTLENSVQATADKAEANFAYDAVLKLNHNGTDYYYNSGFGLATSLNSAAIPVGSTDSSTPSANSEFWIKASKLKFTDANSANPYEAFTYENNVFTYNGEVSFNYATPTDVSTAQTNAINAAASDATTKAGTAQTNAINHADTAISAIVMPDVPTTTTSTGTPSGTGYIKGSIWRQRLTVEGATQYMHWIFDGDAWRKVGGTYINGSDIVTGTIDADRINANDLFSQNINVNNRFTVDSSGNTSIKSGTSGARMEIENNVIKVFDTNGVLRVKMGDLTA